MQRVEVRYEGRVQGVGFRMSVADIARSFEVSGTVCNRADGTVELIAEGLEDELARFHQAILQRMERYIVNFHESWSAVEQPSPAGFRIGPDKNG